MNFKVAITSKRFRKDIRDMGYATEVLGTFRNALKSIPDIAVGLPANLKFKSGARYPGRAGSGSEVRTPPTVIEVGFWNDQGTRHIPPRPFLTGADGDIDRVTLKHRKAMCKAVIKATKDGGLSRDATYRMCSVIGAVAASEVKRRITEWREPPNAPRTIAAKKGVNNPLVDTGLLRSSVTWELRDKKEAGDNANAI